MRVAFDGGRMAEFRPYRQLHPASPIAYYHVPVDFSFILRFKHLFHPVLSCIESDAFFDRIPFLFHMKQFNA